MFASKKSIIRDNSANTLPLARFQMQINTQLYESGPALADGKVIVLDVGIHRAGTSFGKKIKPSERQWDVLLGGYALAGINIDRGTNITAHLDHLGKEPDNV
ncbi:MAG: hypothetical protein QNK37_20600 [Acidobacteriota bacterium]|nr:hypothetical protein [Acidobacteriota bacterium]